MEDTGAHRESRVYTVTLCNCVRLGEILGTLRRGSIPLTPASEVKERSEEDFRELGLPATKCSGHYTGG